MEQRTTRVGDVPVLLVSETFTSPRPALLWFHGLGSCKEDNRAELEFFAGAGFLAVGVDAVAHGERRHPELHRWIDAPRDATLRHMIGIVEQSVAELPGLIDALHAQGLSDAPAASLVGVSMGGYIAYAAAVRENRLRSVVALLGNPEWPQGESPSMHAHEIPPTPLLSITAGHDESVPPEPARALHRRLGPLYGDTPDRVRYHEIEGAPHLMGGEDWWRAMEMARTWTLRMVASLGEAAKPH